MKKLILMLLSLLVATSLVLGLASCGASEPDVDEPTADEPTSDDPTAEDPTKDDPTVDDPEADDPTNDDPTNDDPTVDDPTKDDTTTDDPTTDEPGGDCGTEDKPTSVTKTDYDKILERGYFVCGVTIFDPMNYVDINGEWTGFDTDFARAVAKEFGVDVRFQEIDWQQKYNLLNAGDIDCIWNGFGYSDVADYNGVSRLELVDFTTPYLICDGFSVVVLKDRASEFKSVADFIDKMAACAVGTAAPEIANTLNGTANFDKTLLRDSQSDALFEVMQGYADFAVVDTSFAKGECEWGKFVSLTVLDDYRYFTDVYAVGCRKGSDLADKINEVMKTLLSNGVLRDIAMEYGFSEYDLLVGDIDIPTDDGPVIDNGPVTDEPTVDLPPVHEHTPGTPVEEKRIDSTCKDYGFYEVAVYCTECDAELSREFCAINTLKEHTPGEAVEENRREASCDSNGAYDLVVYCTVCSDEISRDTEVILSIEHTPREAVIENRVEPGCLPGSYDSVVYCDACEGLISREKFTLPAVHNLERKKCVDCGYVEASEGLIYGWNSDGKTYSVSKGSACTDTEIGIPNSYNGVPVTSVAKDAFRYDTTITYVVIAEGVEKVDENAFSECTALSEVVIPESVTFLANSSFFCTAITSISLPGVQTIGSAAFKGCANLTDVNLGDKITVIGSSAFARCVSLAEFNIPESVTGLGGYVFEECTLLTSVTIPDGVLTLDSVTFGGCTNLETVYIGSGLTTIGVMEFVNCPSLVSIEVSEDNASFKSVDGVLYSKDGKTLYCYPSAKEDVFFTIPNNVTTVYTYAFYGATNLSSIQLPQSLTKINDNAFKNCFRLTEVINKSYMRLSLSVTTDGYIGYYAREIHGANSTKLIDVDGLLFQKGNTKYYLVGYVGDASEITIPDYYNGYEYEIIPYAFYGNKTITKVTLSPKVASLPKYAFAECTSLESVTLSSKLRNIGEYAFAGCTALTEADFDDEFITYWRTNRGEYIRGLTDTAVAAECLSVTYANIAWKM